MNRHASVYGVSRHPSPMSRDITDAPGVGLEPAAYRLGDSIGPSTLCTPVR
jgi:hypothetical protein